MAYDYNNPNSFDPHDAPPRPTPDELALAHEQDSSDDPRVQAAINKRRNWRNWNAQLDEYKDQQLQRGNSLADLGFKDKHEEGQSDFTHLRQQDQSPEAQAFAAAHPDWVKQYGGSPYAAMMRYNYIQQGYQNQGYRHLPGGGFVTEGGRGGRFDQFGRPLPGQTGLGQGGSTMASGFGASPFGQQGAPGAQSPFGGYGGYSPFGSWMPQGNLFGQPIPNTSDWNYRGGQVTGQANSMAQGPQQWSQYGGMQSPFGGYSLVGPPQGFAQPDGQFGTMQRNNNLGSLMGGV